MRRIVILGSTGSIGMQTLEVVRAHAGRFKIIGLSAHGNTTVFRRQLREFKPKYFIQTAGLENPEQAICALASANDADLIINAISGYAGLAPLLASCMAGKTVALANKESLVMAGDLVMQTAAKNGARILPIDSEPSAIWRLLGAQSIPAASFVNNNIDKVILTASGGPFWKQKKENLANVSADQAVRHPVWRMGKKVSVDSATLMNKAFEIIETHRLFNIPFDKIDVSIHRQSIVHGIIRWKDGNMSAIMSPPDMRIPISYAMFYPGHFENKYTELDLSELNLTFEKPDYAIFKGPRLAYEALREGGIMPAALCIADEIAVEKFLRGEISFLGIYDFIERALAKIKNARLSLEAIKELKSAWEN